MIKEFKDISKRKDQQLNRRGEDYNRALVTVNQNKKEEELMQASLANIMQMQMMQQKEQALLDMMAKIDLQQKLLENKMVTEQPMAMPQELPPMPMQGLPQMPGQGMPPEMGGGIPYDPAMQGMPPEMMAAPPEQYYPAEEAMMPPMY